MSMDRPVRVGTRRSPLAVAQSNIIVNQLKIRYPEIEFELVGISTEGDVVLDKRLDVIGGKGLFVNEIEAALLEGSIDIAVHSMKDMPAVMPEGLTIAAVSNREDPRDVLITMDGSKLDGLRAGSVVGTSSIRREIQLLNMRPDIKIKQLRGNVNTRLDKLADGEYDAIVLAAAGLVRLGLEEKCTQYFNVDEMIPAIGQGILGIQTRKGWEKQRMLEAIHCPDTYLQLEAERAFMIRLNGGCSTPTAAYAVIEGSKLRLLGMLATTSCREGYRAMVEGDKQLARSLGEKLAAIIQNKRDRQESEEG